MGYRKKVMGLARHGDKTSTGAACIGSRPNVNEHELSVDRVAPVGLEPATKRL
jgi:hypothetical protein